MTAHSNVMHHILVILYTINGNLPVCSQMGGYFLGLFQKSDFTLKYGFFLVDQDHRGAFESDFVRWRTKVTCTFLTEQKNLTKSYEIIIIANKAYRLLIYYCSISLISSLYYTTGKLPWEDTGSIYISMILERKIYSNASQGEVSREEGFLVRIIIEKMGLG